MKRFIIYLPLLVVISFVFGFIAFAHQAPAGNDTAEFAVKSDGSVIAGEKEFKNLSEYVRSDYFREMGKRCGTTRRFNKNRSLDRPLASTGDCTLKRTVIKNEYWPGHTYTIPVVFHIIHRTDGTGNISDQRIYGQLDVLNEDYRAMAGTLGEKGFDSKIQFQLVDITRTANNQWFQDKQEEAFKKALGWDQQRYLNVYTNTAGGDLGYSSLPQEDAGNVYDGVVVLYESVGGRDNGFEFYDQGRTLVHEVGHYLGLEHTFHGDGCHEGYNAGDLIADTNSENREHEGCTQTYTCGTADPIHNYMNYTDDSCMYEFTSEQANRMVCSLVNYRPLLYQTIQSSITVTSPNGGESWTAGSTYTVKWTSTGSVGNVKIQYSINNGSSWTSMTSSTANDGGYSWTLPGTTSSQCLVKIMAVDGGTPSDTSNSVFSIIKAGGSSPIIGLDRTELYFAAVTGGTQTGNQQVRIDNSGNGILKWELRSNKPWLNCTPTFGTGAGVIAVSVNPSGLAVDSYTGTITVTSYSAANSPQTISVYLTVKSAFQDQPPFGDFSTPLSGSTVSGSIPVTGWALDDVEVEDVKIYYGPNYIGDAVFVEGARPDVEGANPGYPGNYRAGWGYMLLTNFFPNGGNGTYTLYAVAADSGGNQVTLGYKTIICDNANAVKPFGAIDTPAQGGTASGGGFVNRGWVLTPHPNSIPTDGSTIDVWVDGVALGHPTYNIYRSDVAALFPGYANRNGAGGYFYLDTTAYENGVHTIYWTARDNAGNSDGIGSRFFTIQNTGNGAGRRARGAGRGAKHMDSVDYFTPLQVKKGHNRDIKPKAIYPDESGIINIRIKELQRLEINLGYSAWMGYQVIGDRLRALPVGSTLDIEKNIFYWQPGPGFVGDYRLVFIDKHQTNARKINITILPKN